MKAFKRTISSVLILCIMISTIGYTAVSFACPRMASASKATCSKCEQRDPAPMKRKDCCKPIVEHKVVRTDSTRPDEVHCAPIVTAVLPRPVFALSNDTDLFGNPLPEFRFHTPPLPPDASTARAMLSTFLI